MSARTYDYDLIRELAYEDGLSASEIVERVGCARSIVYKVLNPERYGGRSEAKRRWDRANARRPRPKYRTTGYGFMVGEVPPDPARCKCDFKAPDEDDICDLCGRIVPNECQ